MTTGKLQQQLAVIAHHLFFRSFIHLNRLVNATPKNNDKEVPLQGQIFNFFSQFA